MSRVAAASAGRQPTGSARVYRALAHHLERFLQLYGERFEGTRGRLRRWVEKAAHRYLDCGIFAQGASRVHCEACGHDYLVELSCKQRCLCPSCHQKRELLWAECAEEELLAEVRPLGWAGTWLVARSCWIAWSGPRRGRRW